jgi:hypothetical protein
LKKIASLLLLIPLLGLLWAAPAWADGLQFTGNCSTLAWNADIDADLAGYKLYDRISLSNPYTLLATVGTNITSLPCSQFNFNTGQHYISLTAFDASGNESAHSTEVPFVIVGDKVNDLAVTVIHATDVTLSFMEVDDGTGNPASYDVRFATPTITFNTAASVTSGTCAYPLAGTTIGATKTCTVTGLSATTPYQFQLRPQHGVTPNLIFGPVSNVASGTTGGVPPPVTVRYTVFSDNFNRADAGTLGSNWIVYPVPLAIVSNQVRGTISNSNGSTEVYNGSLPNDQWVEWTLSTLSGSDRLTGNLVVRVPPSYIGSGGYACEAFTNSAGLAIRISRLDPYTVLFSDSSFSWASPDVGRCEAQGNVITFYRNNVSVGSVIDNTYASGTAGISMYIDPPGPLSAFITDDVSVGGFVSPSTEVCGCDGH